MIDTLRLNLTDCEIKRSCPLSVQPGILDYSTGKIHNENDLFIDTTGKIIRGSKAYLNDDKFNLTINPTVESEINDYGQNKLKLKRFKRIDEKIQKDIWDYNSDTDQVKGIFVQTSLPRLLSETNLKTLTFDEQKTALKILEAKLKEYGIKTNILNAGLSRVDTFTNLKTDYSFFAYSNLFSLMECSRMKSVGYADESFLWKNGNQQLAVYDKILEIRKKNPESKLKDKNVMRLENRLLKKRSVQSKLKFLTVSELYNNFDEVKNYHKKEIEKKIFRYDLDEIEMMTETDLKQKFLYAKEIYGKKWFNNYCFNFGLFTVSRIADINFLTEIISELDGCNESQLRLKKHRIAKKINEAKFHFGRGGIFSDQTVNFKSNVELYNELKIKFYKEVA